MSSVRWTPARVAGLAAVLGVAVLCSFWGITVRDLADTELDEFSGSGPMGILRRSISPTSGDWGAHMPLSHLIRWHVVRLIGEQSPLAWRLHSATGAVLAAALTWWAVARQGRLALAAAAGLIVAAHPVMSFHAHESTNYALGPVLGGALLLALLAWERDRPRAGVLLGVAAVVGLFNDLFFVFPVAFAFLWTAARAAGVGATLGEVRRRFLVTWGIVAGAGLGPAVWFLVHLGRLDAEQIIGPHADPIPSESVSLLGAAWDLSLRFAGGYLGGYLDAGDRDPWTTWAPLALLVLIAVRAARDRSEQGAVHRLATWMALGSFALILLVRLGFGLAFGREFTTEPRIFSALLIPLVLGWSGLCAALGRRAGLLALGGLLVAVAIPTARQLGNLSARDSRAAAFIVEHHRSGDLLLVNRQVRWRLPPDLVSDDMPDCLSDASEDTLPDRIWIARPGDGQELPVLWTCDGAERDLLGSGRWRLRHHARWFPPAYDRRSASFLPELNLQLVERGAPSVGPGNGRPVDVSFRRRPLDGGGGVLLARAGLVSSMNGRPADGEEPLSVDVPWAEGVRFEELPVGHWMRLEVRAQQEPSASLNGLLGPMYLPLLDLDPVPILADPLEPARSEALPAFSAPALRVAERALRALLAFGLAIGLLVAGVRPPRSW